MSPPSEASQNAWVYMPTNHKINVPINWHAPTGYGSLGGAPKFNGAVSGLECRPDVRAAVKQAGRTVRQFYCSVSLVEYSSSTGGSSSSDSRAIGGGSGSGKMATFNVSVGDTVLVEWERGPEASALGNVTVYRVYALFEVSSSGAVRKYKGGTAGCSLLCSAVVLHAACGCKLHVLTRQYSLLGSRECKHNCVPSTWPAAEMSSRPPKTTTRAFATHGMTRSPVHTCAQLWQTQWPVLALQDDQGVPCTIPEWLYFWEDIVEAPHEPGQPDGCMRGRRQLFPQARHGPDGADFVLGGRSAK